MGATIKEKLDKLEKKKAGDRARSEKHRKKKEKAGEKPITIWLSKDDIETLQKISEKLSEDDSIRKLKSRSMTITELIHMFSDIYLKDSE